MCALLTRMYGSRKSSWRRFMIPHKRIYPSTSRTFIKIKNWSKIELIRNPYLIRQEGSRNVQRNIDHYNLDVIIAFGYRVHSQVATRFRRWATERLYEYIQKGFSMDDDRLKQGGAYSGAYPFTFRQSIKA
ncbi:hypothetical protein IX321_002562 [Bacteroides pyogenes]|nr:hypothetical protein [Bacteroides pyogenes]MBR8718636.1 hypothetical protein [Bacteroides pyogenes]MBR8748093.1 hypothetical protein [Bacteroides pyogenes]MBR8758385.1 hypothetical protein [Bacteroides pyogenes]MBR8781605.1 hypothetical protein [Bacteroides pyogenes]